VAPRVTDLVGVVAVVVGELQGRPVLVHLLGTEVDVGERVGLPAALLLVVQVGLIPVEAFL